MNHQRKVAALKNYATASKAGTKEEVAALLKEDAKNYGVEEQEEILAALFPAANSNNSGNSSNSGAGTPGPAKKAAAAKEGPANPTVSDQLDGIDYNALTGKTFKKYVELVGDRSVMVIDEETGKETALVGQLLLNEEFIFEQYKATPVMKDRFPGVEGTPKDYVGLKINNTTPIHTSKMSVKAALEMNAQILNQHSRAGHGKYYLLKK